MRREEREQLLFYSSFNLDFSNFISFSYFFFTSLFFLSFFPFFFFIFSHSLRMSRLFSLAWLTHPTHTPVLTNKNNYFHPYSTPLHSTPLTPTTVQITPHYNTLQLTTTHHATLKRIDLNVRIKVSCTCKL